MDTTPPNIEKALQQLNLINKKRKIQSRHKKLKELLELIDNKQFNSAQVPQNELLNDKSPRLEYKSPLERSTQNYGYMQIDEMTAATPNIW